MAADRNEERNEDRRAMRADFVQTLDWLLNERGLSQRRFVADEQIADYGRPEKLISKAKFLLGDSTLHADDEANLHVIALALTAIADMMAKTRGELIDGSPS